MKKTKNLVTADKTVYTVGYLRQVSWHTLNEAKENEIGQYLNCMSSMVFSAFTIEAYLNHLGGKTIPFWITIERNLSPSKKLDVIAKQLSISIDYGVRPFHSFKSLFKFRDFLAHGRTEQFEIKSVQFLAEGEQPKLPISKWQEQVTLENAKKYFDDVKDMIEFLHAISGDDLNPLFMPETAGWLITPINSNSY